MIDLNCQPARAINRLWNLWNLQGEKEAGIGLCMCMYSAEREGEGVECLYRTVLYIHT